MSLTVAILTLNEESNVSRALRSASFADELLVIDSGSTDSTVALAVAAGARVLERPFENFAHQRNFALENASGEWIFFLDADECITEDLASEIQSFLAEPSKDAAKDSYRIARVAIALGERLEWHPGGQDAPIRLVRKGVGRFEGVVHERFVAASPPGIFKGKIEHRTHRSVSDLVQRIDRYSTLESKDLAARGARVVPPWRVLWTMTSTAWRYWRQGLKKHGMAGAIEACALAFDRALVLGKVWEAHEQERIAAEYPDHTPDAPTSR